MLGRRGKYEGLRQTAPSFRRSNPIDSPIIHGSMEPRQAWLVGRLSPHSPKVVDSNPTPATREHEGLAVTTASPFVVLATYWPYSHRELASFCSKRDDICGRRRRVKVGCCPFQSLRDLFLCDDVVPLQHAPGSRATELQGDRVGLHVHRGAIG